jgi:type III pantothenate kinase
MNAVPLIAVDIGNSLTKLAWFDAQSPDQWSRSVGQDLSCHTAAGQVLPYTLPQPAKIIEFPTGQAPGDNLAAELPAGLCRWRVASVQREGQRVLADWVQAHRTQDDYHALALADLPITVRVDHPDRVGLDRLAAAVAANALREAGRPAIVVQAGTAMTVNLIDVDGAFAGGAILPGFRMQAEALFGGADLLPLAILEPQGEPPGALGKNTENAIRSGLFWGAVGAVRELVARIAEPLAHQPQVFVTGGDITRLAPLVGGDTRFVPNMVLAGIALACCDN